MSEETTTPGSNRTPRGASSRSTKAARKPWTPPQVLETPEAPDGMQYRWVRTHIRGEADKTNVHMRFREGYEPVHPSEVQGYELPVIDEGNHAGTVGVGGLMLTKIPKETVEERNAYFAQQTDQQMNAVDNDLMRDEHPAMPISKERKTQVSFGRGNKST
jgi:hypothetical protein|tara:strand:+ start:658 stop:1137 length:480 start_codon:yes stop_codon:yes gene_type:complete